MVTLIVEFGNIRKKVYSQCPFLYFHIATTHLDNEIDLLWKIKAPQRALGLGWLAIHGSILTMDNLYRKNVIVVNACPLCLSDEESVEHLLLNCNVAWKVWYLVLGGFGCS